MRASLIITAAGSSSRFRQSSNSAPSSKPQNSSKIFIELGGVPVLERTLRAFSQMKQVHETIVTVQAGTERAALAWAKKRGLKKMKFISGGKTRAESVFFALKKTSSRNEWVIVHDGARPFVRTDTIKQLCSQAAKHDGILLARQVVPTIKRISKSRDRVEATVDRTQLAEAETPQIVKRKLLLEAYRQVPNAFAFTDESSLVEAMGGKMGVMLHTDWNPKLTHYADYELAEAKMSSGAEFRIGKGYDIHRLVSGRKLWVGGVCIPFEKGSLGHSDGDALLHSITDAILGALGLGDIGDWFSDKNPKYKNIQSTKLLEQVLAAAHKKGWQPHQMDANLILEKPKLGLMKTKIRKSVARLLKLPLEKVSVKARTYEGLPPFGTSEAWAAETLIMMRNHPNPLG